MVAERQRMTIYEFAAIDEPGHFDLVDGELWKMSPTNFEHGGLIVQIAVDLKAYLKNNPIGKVVAGDVGFVLDRSSRTILCPDVAFVVSARLPLRKYAGLVDGFPDLAVEVISPSERPGEIQTKISKYLNLGTAEVWCVYPEQERVIVYLVDSMPLILGPGEMLTSESLLPGLSIDLSETFAY